MIRLLTGRCPDVQMQTVLALVLRTEAWWESTVLRACRFVIKREQWRRPPGLNWLGILPSQQANGSSCIGYTLISKLSEPSRATVRVNVCYLPNSRRSILVSYNGSFVCHDGNRVPCRLGYNRTMSSNHKEEGTDHDQRHDTHGWLSRSNR